jgi:hypothetical protein
MSVNLIFENYNKSKVSILSVLTSTGKTADRSKKENHERKESYVFAEVYN